jgi:hypothetical protein
MSLNTSSHSSTTPLEVARVDKFLVARDYIEQLMNLRGCELGQVYLGVLRTELAHVAW